MQLRNGVEFEEIRKTYRRVIAICLEGAIVENGSIIMCDDVDVICSRRVVACVITELQYVAIHGHRNDLRTRENSLELSITIRVGRLNSTKESLILTYQTGRQNQDQSEGIQLTKLVSSV